MKSPRVFFSLKNSDVTTMEPYPPEITKARGSRLYSKTTYLCRGVPSNPGHGGYRAVAMNGGSGKLVTRGAVRGQEFPTKGQYPRPTTGPRVTRSKGPLPASHLLAVDHVVGEVFRVHERAVGGAYEQLPDLLVPLIQNGPGGGGHRSDTGGRRRRGGEILGRIIAWPGRIAGPTQGKRQHRRRAT